MFIGHYAVAPLAAAHKGFKLWHGFIAVQLVDFAWAVFILLGIEKARIVPGFTEATPLDLHFMPYTHSLLFTFIWAVVGGLTYKFLTKSKAWTGALIFGVLVLSHWIADVIVHIPDMTLWPGSEKLGLGLWRSVELSFPLELILFVAAMAYYIRKTDPAGPRSHLWTGLFISLMVVLQIYNNFGPAPGSTHQMAISAFIGFSLLTFIASRFERTRIVPDTV